MLGLNVGRLTSVDSLIAAVWADDPPETARGQIQVCVSGLRKVFAEAGHPDAITTVSPGYRLDLGPDDVDTLQFTHLVTAAKEANDAQAAAHLHAALALWRGPALAGVDSELVRRGATALDERRLAVIEDRVRLDLQLGQHRQLVPELHALVAEHPLRERLHELLMLALYRSGRPAEALGAYRGARAVIVEEIGVEPGQELRDLERAILNRDPALRPQQADPVAPRQTPASVADFTGRHAEVDAIVRALTGTPGHALPVVAISGRGGVGKSSLAVRVAHEVAGRFPDGQLYADLRDGDPLARFLRALGVAVPDTADERAALYRTTLAGRRVLVVLDDVTVEDRALPLFPGDPGCAVIMTSRTRLGHVPGAHHVDLAPLDTDAALTLLARIVGEARVRTQPNDARALAHLCEGLPLALRIAGARLAARPAWRIAGLVDRLRDETRRLDELTHRGRTVRSSITPTYQALPADARRLFRLLAVVETPELPAWAAAALLDTPVADAEAALESLADARLLDPTADHYRLPTLIRLYAKEIATPDETNAALSRVFGGWLARAEPLLRSSAPRWCPPSRWWDPTPAALVAVVAQAARAGHVAACWDLALTYVPLFERTGHLDEWKTVTELAHEAARKAGDLTGVAAMRFSMGTWCLAQSRFAEADRCLAEAVEAFIEAGNDEGVVLSLRDVGLAHPRLDDRVRESLHAALRRSRAAADPLGEANALYALGALHHRDSRPTQATRTLTDALTVSEARLVTAKSHHLLGEIALGSKDFPTAVRHLEAARELFAEQGSTVWLDRTEALLSTALGGHSEPGTSVEDSASGDRAA